MYRFCSFIFHFIPPYGGTRINFSSSPHVEVLRFQLLVFPP